MFPIPGLVGWLLAPLLYDGVFLRRRTKVGGEAEARTGRPVQPGSGYGPVIYELQDGG